MIKYPQNLDLRRLVRFSPEDGTIWLAENRMLLLHATALAGLRKELINSVGPEHARRVFTRMGYASGARDAELTRTIRGGQDPLDAFAMGPQLHMLEGSVRTTPVKVEMDIPTGKFYGEFRWDNSWEAQAHVAEFGPQKDPVCWMLLGYASGYTSAFMGRFVLFKEIECAACGAGHCGIVGKPLEEWPDGAEHMAYYEADSIVSRLLELSTQVDVLRCSLEQKRESGAMIGASPAFRRAYELVEKAARTNVTVLLSGETGVGKERFARALHQTSARAAGPFVAVNCAALPHDLVESELFGAEKGAYTGAHATRIGKFERAEGGTLFLDEIGELPLAAQAKILRVLQEGEIERLGDDKTRKVNVRIVAATNVELPAAVKGGRFRADLYYRLNVYPIAIPPLRERVLDIAPLVAAMMEKYGALHDKRLAGITDKATKALNLYQWPGNVRELENLIERGIILAPQDGWIEIEHLFPSLDMGDPAESGIGEAGQLEQRRPAGHSLLCDAILGGGLSLDELETMLLAEAVERSAGNLAGAARMLGLTRPQFTYRLKRNQEANTAKE
ncbi:MAG: sigma-54-dependent Fis family transcriptional regulator [Burkholderiaceae bacterium]|nr:sigma-54-dependent Fis family transcriptional regulator [Burkholderiaceae bacterium]